MKLSLRTKLTLSFAILVVGALLAMGTITYNRAKAIVEHDIQVRNEQTVQDVERYYLRNFMREMAYVVELWAGNPSVINYEKAPGQPKIVKSIPDNFQGVFQQLYGYVKGDSDIAWLYLGLEDDGSSFFAPIDPTMPQEYDCRTRDWYIGAAKNRGHVYWTEPYLDAGNSGEMLVTVSKAVVKNGKLVGVMAMDIKIQKFSELIRGLNSSGGGYLMLMGKDGTVYAHPDSRQLMLNKTTIPWIGGMMKKDHGSGYFTDNQQAYLYSFITVPQTGWKLVSVSAANVDSVVREVRSWTLDAALLCIVGVLILGGLVTLIFLRPLEDMMGAIRQVSSGEMDARMPVETRDELGELSKEFNRMIGRIENLMQERDDHVTALIERNKEINEQKMEITALYEETEAMNDALNDLLTQVRGSYLATVKSLANAIEANDDYTRGHCDRVRLYAMKLAERLNLQEQDRTDLEFASTLHDIGKLGVPSEILNKPGRLTDTEFEIVKQHPAIGYDILEGVEFLENCRMILRQHHEWVNGRGYPDGISGDDILYSARILAIADAYDAMTSSRPYRNRPLTREIAIEELKKASGTQFDPSLTDAFVQLLEDEAREEFV